MLKFNVDQKAKEAVQAIRQNYDVMFVIGIGGSYAGSKAAIELLETDFPVEFIGAGFETERLELLWQKYQAQRIKLCVISKSGKTFEVVAALEYMEKKLRVKYGAKFNQHVIAITGQEGKLHDYVTKHHIEYLLHPDIGGRYSVLSVVGLFPMAVAGIDTEAMENAANDPEILVLAKKYATERFFQYQGGKRVEIFAVSQTKAIQFGNWYQQLFSESEGKDHKGMWTSVLLYSRDLHSMGQFIQQGTPILCETIINVCDTHNQMQHLNQICIDAVAEAHCQAGVQVTRFDLNCTAADLGRLFKLFLNACVIYCELLGVDPYNQPGVENYKTEMRRLLKL